MQYPYSSVNGKATLTPLSLSMFLHVRRGRYKEASLGEGCSIDPHRTTEVIGSLTVPFSVVLMITHYKLNSADFKLDYLWSTWL